MPSPAQSEGQSQGPSSVAPVSPESSHPSCTKGKKRHWSEQDAGSHYQVSSPKLENSSAKPQKREHNTKLEDVSSLVETKVGLDSHSRVERLVFIMRQVQNDHTKKYPDEIRQWIKVAGVIATTEQGNFLNHFIRLGGLSSLDQWLQDACKGKLGESDGVREEFISALLNALENLPIDEEALKTCSIRKSVKHLHNHKNYEIQRKAKNLIHTWKNRVNSEMKTLDETTGESNHDPVQEQGGESGSLQEGVNSKYTKPEGYAIVGGNCGNVSDEEKASGAEVQQSRVSASLDLIPPEELKDVSISQQDSLGSKEVLTVNLNGVVMEKCIAKPIHLEHLSNKCCVDAEEASVHSAEDVAPTGIQSSKIREKDTVSEGVGESAEPMEFDDCIVRGKSADLKVPVNTDLDSQKRTDGDLPIACQVAEADEKTEPCHMKGARINDSGSISTIIMSSINSSISDHQPSIVPTKVVDDTNTYWYGIEPTSECGVAKDCGRRKEVAAEVSGASYSAGHQEDTGTSDGGGIFRINTARGRRLCDELDSRINIEETSMRPNEKKSEEDVGRDTESDLHFVEDDALEVARQVGKEAEQEVESYNEPLCSSSSEGDVKGAPGLSTTAESAGREQELILVQQNATGTSYCSKNLNLKAQSGKDDDNSQGKCVSEEIDLSSTNTKVVTQELESCKMTIASQESITHETEAKTTNSNEQMQLQIKCIFDLNEDIPAEEPDSSQDLIHGPTVATTSASNCTITNVSTPIPVVAASKGLLNLPTSPLHFKGELGWRGSAATSAFRPAEPRRTPERDRTQSAEENNSPHKPGRRFFEFDLNVADADGDAAMDLFSGGHGGERHVPASTSLPSGDSSMEVSSSRRTERLTLDLNCLCEADDSGPGLLSGCRGVERLGALQKLNQSPSPTSSRPAVRDFDLNDNLLDDTCAYPHDSEQKRFSMKSINNSSGLDDPVVSILGARIDSDISKLPPAHAACLVSPWDNPHSNFRREFPNSAQSFLVSGPSAVSSLNHMGRMLSMPSGLPYPSTSLTFPYNGVALGSSFPISSAVFAPGSGPYMVESMGAPIPQMVGPATISPSLTRPPYLMGVGSGVGTSNTNGIIRPNLDLNSGVVPADVEGREAGGKMRQLFPQANHMLVEEQIRPYQPVAALGPPLKRKEPECQWESCQIGYKQATTWR